MSSDQTRRELGAVRAAVAAGVQRVVKLSVWRADEELNPIARIHRPVELAIQTSGLAWTFLRPNFYMQNFTRDLATQIAAGRLPQPASDAPISFVDARDVARVAAAVLTSSGHDGATYPISGPQALTYHEAADIFAQELGHPVDYLPLSDEHAREAMAAAGTAEFAIDAILGVARAYRSGGADTVLPTITSLTGRQPTTLAQFAREHRARFGPVT